MPAWFQLVAWAGMALVLFRAWPALRAWARTADEESVRILFATTLVLTGMRWFNTSVLSGLPLHFLGAGIATLMFGPWRACWVMAVVSLGSVLLGASWNGLAADFLASGALPVAVIWWTGRLAAPFLPRNIFTWIFVNAFAASALGMSASMLVRAALAAWVAGADTSAYLGVTPMLAFGEAFFTGAAMSFVVVYRPTWCSTFDDDEHLLPRRPM